VAHNRSATRSWLKPRASRVRVSSGPIDSGAPPADPLARSRGRDDMTRLPVCSTRRLQF
jgi:hypothetical protein